QLNAAKRESDAGGATDESEQYALGERLTEQAAASGPECQADGDLTMPRRRSREHQVGHIDTRDQKYEPDCAGQDEQCRSHGRDKQVLHPDELVSGRSRRLWAGSRWPARAKLLEKGSDFRG